MERAASRNLAWLLARTARAWPRLPAVAIGRRVLQDYASLAARAARIGRGVADVGLASGDRVAIVARNVPQYVEALFACWWAGLVAVPVNAKLHPAEVAYVLEDSGARCALVDESWQSALASTQGDADAPRVIRLGSDGYENLARSDPLGRTRRVRRRRRGVAVLHQRYDRTAEGRRHHARQPARDGAMLCRRRRSDRAR